MSEFVNEQDQVNVIYTDVGKTFGWLGHSMLLKIILTVGMTEPLVTLIDLENPKLIFH